MLHAACEKGTYEKERSGGKVSKDSEIERDVTWVGAGRCRVEDK